MAENGKLPASDLAPIAQGQLRKDCAAGWNAMNVEARSKGLEIVPTGSKSSYRTYAQQQELYQAYLNGTGNLAAVPGTSNHGWGTAVDVATQAMRSMIDSIGAKYGYSKSWSDAPSEWWHIVYQSGHYSGKDPGPKGETKPAPPKYDPAAEGGPVVLNKDGRIEVFAGEPDGGISHRWQLEVGGEWNKQWAGLGRPGQGAEMISVVSNKDGRLEVFAVDDTNRVTHRWQTEPGGSWNAEWAGIGHPGDVKEKGSTITAILRKDGCVAVFVQTAKGGVWRRWQTAPGKQLNDAWANMGQP